MASPIRAVKLDELSQASDLLIRSFLLAGFRSRSCRTAGGTRLVARTWDLARSAAGWSQYPSACALRSSTRSSRISVAALPIQVGTASKSPESRRLESWPKRTPVGGRRSSVLLWREVGSVRTTDVTKLSLSIISGVNSAGRLSRGRRGAGSISSIGSSVSLTSPTRRHSSAPEVEYSHSGRVCQLRHVAARWAFRAGRPLLRDLRT